MENTRKLKYRKLYRSTIPTMAYTPCLMALYVYEDGMFKVFQKEWFGNDKCSTSWRRNHCFKSAKDFEKFAERMCIEIDEKAHN